MDAEVVDASALAALLFGEPDADVVTERLGDAALFSPSLVRYELASVCLKKVRKYPAQQAGLVAAYDAAYLWVTGHVGAPLLTLDQEMARAASRLGFSLVT